MAKQFVGQEFVAAGQEELYHWSREAKSSSAEVDFLITIGLTGSWFNGVGPRELIDMMNIIVRLAL